MRVSTSTGSDMSTNCGASFFGIASIFARAAATRDP
jgi:hypothetical protein